MDENEEFEFRLRAEQESAQSPQLAEKPTDRSLSDQALREAGLFARSAGPALGGAALGAAAGSVFPVVGTTAGGVAGLTAGAVTQGIDKLLGTRFYDKALTAFGVPEPETSGERIRAAVTEAIPAAAAFPRVAAQAAETLSSGSLQNIARLLAERPDLQLKAAPISAAASQATAEQGGRVNAQLTAGLVAPIATSSIGSITGGLTRRVRDVLDSALTKGGPQRAAGRVITDVAKDDAAYIQSLLRNSDPESPLTAAQQVVPVGRAEFSGLERLTGTRNPSAYGAEGTIAANSDDWLKQAWQELNRNSTKAREDVLMAANQGASGYKLNASPLLADVNTMRADPALSNVTSEKILDFVAKRLTAKSNPNTGDISAEALYNLRKDLGLKIEQNVNKGKWDKSVAAKLMGDVQKSIDWHLEKASGMLTPQGGPAWTDAYLKPFSARASELTTIKEAPAISKSMGSAGAQEAARISRIDEAPFSFSNVLSRPVMIVNAIIRSLQGRGGEKATQEIARLMLPENKRELANVITSELAMRNSRPDYISKLRADILSGALYSSPESVE